MNETVNQESTATQQEECTFTQSELNVIVSDRLAREREKYAGFDEFKAKAEKFDAAEEAAKSLPRLVLKSLQRLLKRPLLLILLSALPATGARRDKSYQKVNEFH